MAPGNPQGSGSLLRRLGLLAVNPRRWPEIAIGLARLVLRFVGEVFDYVSYLRSFVRRRKQFVEERWSGLKDLSAARRVAVFNHFDQNGVLHDFVLHYVRQLNEAGFTVVFVSNSPRLPRATIDPLLPLCALILRRANVGYDFGALKDGIAEIPSLERIDVLLVANDSVYGPFCPLKDIVARMDARADVWGITDSWEHRFHLQSFFLLFNRAALQSPAFARFWSGVRYVQSKGWIIKNYELGLTRALVAAGLRCRALFPYEAAIAALQEAVEDGALQTYACQVPKERKYLRAICENAGRGEPLNGTHYFWDFLIERMGCPFLKRELLRDNPMGVPFIRHWEQVVGSAGSYDTAMVARHLALSLRNRPIPDPIPDGTPRRSWYEHRPPGAER